MLRNLKAELARSDKRVQDIAAILGVSYKTAKNKVNGSTPFNCSEMFKLKRKLFPCLTVDYLFDDQEGA